MSRCFSSLSLWLMAEANSRTPVEQGKGRKSVILVGRPRGVFKLSWTDLGATGGVGEGEYWSKLSREGMCLYTTSSVHSLLGYSSEEIRELASPA